MKAMGRAAGVIAWVVLGMGVTSLQQIITPTVEYFTPSIVLELIGFAVAGAWMWWNPEERSYADITEWVMVSGIIAVGVTAASRSSVAIGTGEDWIYHLLGFRTWHYDASLLYVLVPVVTMLIWFGTHTPLHRRLRWYSPMWVVGSAAATSAAAAGIASIQALVMSRGVADLVPFAVVFAVPIGAIVGPVLYGSFVRGVVPPAGACCICSVLAVLAVLFGLLQNIASAFLTIASAFIVTMVFQDRYTSARRRQDGL